MGECETTQRALLLARGDTDDLAKAGIAVYEVVVTGAIVAR
jgi:hypothetical protein